MTTAQPVPFITDPTGREHLLTGETITIGRAVENDIVITSKRVSRKHARVRREGGEVVLEDLGSTNGTFLNDERILAPTPLHDDDCIAVGDVTSRRDLCRHAFPRAGSGRSSRRRAGEPALGCAIPQRV